MGTVRLDGLTKVYDDGRVAVDRVDLTIDDGEFFVVLGPSGCGKTSLLRMIAGLEPISAGDITVDHRSILRTHTRRRELGMLFQQSAVYPHMTVRDNIGFPLKISGFERPEIAQRVEELARQLGLEKFLDARPAQLSGGMQQRVAIGRALARRPSMLLMDEPMSNLDAKLRTELRVELAAAHRSTGATTVYVTHDQVEAMALGTRAAVMRAGRVVQCAPPWELYQAPVDVFVATFVGAPPMSVVRARLEGDTGNWALALGHDRIELGRAARWSGLERWAGRDVAVGLRPEALSLAPDAPSASLRVEVVRVEHLGAHDVAWATLEAHAVTDDGGTITVDPAPVTTIGILLDEAIEVDQWRPIGLVVDVDQVHLFDIDTGRALSIRAETQETA